MIRTLKMCDALASALAISLLCLVAQILSTPLSFQGDEFPENQFEHLKQGDEFPENQFGHLKQRDALQQAEREFEHRDWKLSEDERTADQYLAYLKWREFKNTLDFNPSKPIEKVLDRIVESELYQVLIDFPKGGILHSHEDHQLSKRTLFDIIWASEDFADLYIIPPKASKHAWNMDFFVNPPTDEPWIKVKDSGLTKEEILKQNTLIGLLTEEASNNPTDSGLRWQIIDPLWTRASVQLISNVNIKKKYIPAMLEHCYSEGVTYVESRRGFGLDLPLYSLDRSGLSNGTNGKKFFDSSHDYEINFTRQLVKEFASKHPLFIGHKWISYATRAMSREAFQSVMEAVVKLHEKYPQDVIGFDSVGQEDAGHSSLYYLDEYLSLHSKGKSRIPLYLHSVETSWPEDLKTSSLQDDLVSTLENAYETVIFQSKRVGHGKGFVKKPYLRKILKDRKIAVEVCVISNQILGMDVDIRNHYGQILYKEGIPIVLAPDDPGTFGYDNTTVDWYSAFLSWGLNLGDLKQIALNSIEYSGMTDSEKKDAIEKKWKPSWNAYVSKTKATACQRDFVNEALAEGRSVSFSRLMPDTGPQGTKIHVFGSSFEAAICKVPKCGFGARIEVDADYVSNGQLTCIAPKLLGSRANSTLPIYVSLDGETFQYTGFYFTYANVI